ncbi:hypothetical protein KEF29_26555 [Streptomyces tuirus]|uniref:Uncharacterized protein n=1 Tax=Streptomyces tuirus TaxID=68278 RepID=A0A941FC11_9ACTN|nr:hypothetical protein [Streptomyces tuirus]
MFNSKKIAATAAAGVLGSFALLGVGVGQAFGHEGSANCSEDSQGNVRCEQREYRQVTDKNGNVLLVNRSETSCSGSGQVSCGTSFVLKSKKS